MKQEQYVIAIDQSTSASKLFLLDGQGQIVRRYAKSHAQFYPGPGLAEHDASEIWRNVAEGLAQLSQGIPVISAIGISNQRETTVFWNRDTAEPVCPAVVWQDVRGEAFLKSFSESQAAAVRQKTGLSLSAYFPAAKIASVLKANPAILKMAQGGALCIGTVDSYLVYRLTNGGVFQTDVSNASRTQLMNLETLLWDEELLEWFGIPKGCLPGIAHSDGCFGHFSAIPITGVMGDSHAALFGQGCHQPGMAKATYGTGSSVMMHIGDRPTLSAHGLSTSVGYAFQGKVCYVLEGNVTCSGDTLCWLRDEMGLIEDAAQAEQVAASVANTNGVYLVPAFSGLGAPYSNAGARGMLCGMNRGSTRAHIVRAALESMAYQDMDIVQAMQADTGRELQELRVDGGPTRNALLMQFQADLLNCPLQCASASEVSALGAGYMAGISAGLYKDIQSLRQQEGRRYEPQMTTQARKALYQGWQDSVNRCLR